MSIFPYFLSLLHPYPNLCFYAPLIPQHLLPCFSFYVKTIIYQELNRYQTLFLLLSNPFPVFFSLTFFSGRKTIETKNAPTFEYISFHIIEYNVSHKKLNSLYSFILKQSPPFGMSEIFRTGFLLAQMHKIFLTDFIYLFFLLLNTRMCTKPRLNQQIFCLNKLLL